MDDLADAFLSGPCPRIFERGLPPLLAPDPLPPNVSDIERLRILVNRRAYSDALLISNQLLRGSHSHYAPLYHALLSGAKDQPLALMTHQDELVYILTVFLESLVKLHKYNDLQTEIDRWRFCHHHRQKQPAADDAPPSPAWIPWSLHILAASSLRLVENNKLVATNEALDALWAIRNDIQNDTRDDNCLALLHVENTIANIFIEINDWRMALGTIERMIDMVDTVPEKVELLSRQGRIFLQAGGSEQAEVLFQRAAETANPSSNLASTTSLVPVQLSLNQGLLHFSYGKYDAAWDSFRTGLQLLRGVTSHADETNGNGKSFSLLESRNTLYAEICNNMALCAIYTCRLSEALDIMESTVRDDVTKNLTDRVALNLCTLYELASDGTASARKKRVLQLVAKRFFLHDISVENFRVSNQ
jgi:tetratricopeptide (TPR) repeat protein